MEKENNNDIILEKIIEFVKDNKFLYDLREKDYKKNDIKDKAWNKLGTELKMNVNDVKRKWKSLRDSFFREHAKKKNIASGSGAEHTCKWRWYDSLVFLSIPKDSRPETATNIIVDDDYEEDICCDKCCETQLDLF